MTADPVKEVLYWYEKLQIEAWARYPFPKLCAILLHTQSGHVQDGSFSTEAAASAARPLRLRPES
jgi:hypothetical protein